MPDFDVDFCMNRRDEVISYVTREVRQGQRRPDRDVAPAQGARRASATSRARWRSRSPRPTRSRSSCPSRCRARRRRSREAIEDEPRAQGSSTTRARCYRELLDLAERARGAEPPRRQARRRRRHRREAALGVRARASAAAKARRVSSPSTTRTTVEKAGLVKFDFLGLKTLTVIQIAVDLVNRETSRARRGSRSTSTRIPLDDAERLQDDLARRHHRRVPARVERLPRAPQEAQARLLRGHRRRRRALSARARSRAAWSTTSSTASTGARRSSTTHPSLEPILKDTYGVIVYQEQVMQIAQALAGYSLGRPICSAARWARRRPRRWPRRRPSFLDGAKQKGVDAQDRRARLRPDGELRRLRLQPSPLGGVRPAHLPDRVPQAPLPASSSSRALLTCDKDDTDAVVKFIAEAKSAGIAVLRPDVNESDTDFSSLRGPWEGPTPPRAGSSEQSQTRSMTCSGTGRTLPRSARRPALRSRSAMRSC